MLPIIKVYDIDYSFIIKNYLNPEMWQKEWTLFTYRNFIITLHISSINCESKQICFQIHGIDKDREEEYGKCGGIFYCNDTSTYVFYSLNANNINLLKSEIEGAINKVIDRLEKKLIEATDEYSNIMKTKREEQNKLREIAENFLDDENVTNDEIREAYIDWYVDKMTNENSLDSDFIQYHKYTMLSDVWYVFAKATNNNSLLNEIERNIDGEKIEKLKQEYEEYKSYISSDEYEQDMIDGLEDI